MTSKYNVKISHVIGLCNQIILKYLVRLQLFLTDYTNTYSCTTIRPSSIKVYW